MALNSCKFTIYTNTAPLFGRSTRRAHKEKREQRALNTIRLAAPRAFSDRHYTAFVINCADKFRFTRARFQSNVSTPVCGVQWQTGIQAEIPKRCRDPLKPVSCLPALFRNHLIFNGFARNNYWFALLSSLVLYRRPQRFNFHCFYIYFSKRNTAGWSTSSGRCGCDAFRNDGLKFNRPSSTDLLVSHRESVWPLAGPCSPTKTVVDPRLHNSNDQHTLETQTKTINSHLNCSSCNKIFNLAMFVWRFGFGRTQLIVSNSVHNFAVSFSN